jgi:hypothetical protein
MQTLIEEQSDSAETPWTPALLTETAPVVGGFVAAAIVVVMAQAAFRALVKVNRKSASLTRRPRVVGPEDVTEILDMAGVYR